ncbi:sensor histidine kinase [Clostridium polynesiense]|uniref:sensor histidine kinase n=1 Tax=Clostridium polynesiense TaxID=1325933 RepID=UPI000590F4B2|nr:ATP-binding protein [Clostridium polynesiense]
MKISLKRKITLAFIITILGAIVLTSIVSNFSINRNFNNYLVEEHKEKITGTAEFINSLYNKDRDLKITTQEELQRYAVLQDLYIQLKDNNNSVLYTSGTSHLQHNRMMDRMMGSKMHRNSGEYQEEEYPLTSEGKNIGSITIGFFGDSYLSSSALSFISTLNRSFIISAVIAIAFGFFVSLLISNQLSNPLIKITKTANIMRTGNLNVKSEINTSTKEIQELSNSINFLAETLRNQEMLRKRLTSDMAHELRTPLTTLKTHAEAFMDGVWKPTPERLRVFYEEIERSRKMVDSLRDLSKFEQSSLALNKSTLNVSKELKGIIEIFNPLFNKKGYKLDYDIQSDIQAFWDKDKFKQIMNNLLANSLNYLKPEGKVEVTMKKENKNIIIQIMDNGIGIPEKDLPYIFERFYRSDLSRNKNTGGSGIGLTISKALVEAHGGSIKAESTEGRGTVFTLIIPHNEKSL